MSRTLRKFLMIPAAALFAVVGCQSSMSSTPRSMVMPQRAVVVAGGNGGSTTMFLPSSDPKNPVALCSEGTEVCPECKAAAIKYFTTGVLEPKCSRTGAIRTWNTNVGHQ